MVLDDGGGGEKEVMKAKHHSNLSNTLINIL